jgi:hypothetical protein
LLGNGRRGKSSFEGLSYANSSANGDGSGAREDSLSELDLLLLLGNEDLVLSGADKLRLSVPSDELAAKSGGGRSADERERGKRGGASHLV